MSWWQFQHAKPNPRFLLPAVQDRRSEQSYASFSNVQRPPRIHFISLWEKIRGLGYHCLADVYFLISVSVTFLSGGT